jgi:hypothetical protein
LSLSPLGRVTLSMTALDAVPTIAGATLRRMLWSIPG